MIYRFYSEKDICI